MKISPRTKSHPQIRHFHSLAEFDAQYGTLNGQQLNELEPFIAEVDMPWGAIRFGFGLRSYDEWTDQPKLG